MGKGEIAHYEQFLLFPQCFEKACSPGASKGVIVWEWVNHTVPTVELVFFYLNSFISNTSHCSSRISSSSSSITSSKRRSKSRGNSCCSGSTGDDELAYK